MKANNYLKKKNDYITFLTIEGDHLNLDTFYLSEEMILCRETTDTYTRDIIEDTYSMEDKIELLSCGLEIKDFEASDKELNDKLLMVCNPKTPSEMVTNTDSSILERKYITRVLSPYDNILAILENEEVSPVSKTYAFYGNYEIDSLDRYMLISMVNESSRIGTIDKMYFISYSRDLNFSNVYKYEIEPEPKLVPVYIDESKLIYSKMLDILNTLPNEIVTESNKDNSVLFVTLMSNEELNTDRIITAQPYYNSDDVINLNTVFDLCQDAENILLKSLNDKFGDTLLNKELTYIDILSGVEVSIYKVIKELEKNNILDVIQYMKEFTLISLEDAQKLGFIVLNNETKALVKFEGEYERAELNVKTEEEFLALTEEDRDLIMETGYSEYLLGDEFELLGKTISSNDFGFRQDDGAMLIMMNNSPVIIPNFPKELIHSYRLNDKLEAIGEMIK